MEICSRIIKTDVTCVKCVQNNILAGIGGNIHVFDQNGTLQQVHSVLPAQRIYGIIPSKHSIAVYGANKIKILNLDTKHSLLSKECEDWILDLRWVDSDTNIVTLLAHNYICLWTSEEFELLQKVACEERCILYSATIVGDTWQELFVFSGTVFSEVLLWKPSDHQVFSPVLCRLQGHDGVIFSINYNEKLNLIITTSDDRTVRYWNAENILNNPPAQLSPIKTIYGHLARVFKSLIINDSIISAGEDSNIFVWNLHGEFVTKFDAHQNGCVWSLDRTTDGRLVSGGGDSGVTIYPFDTGNRMEEITIGENIVPKIVKIMKSGKIVMISERGILRMFDNDKWKIVEVFEDLQNYVVLEISKCRKFLALGGFHGTIHIYEEYNDDLRKICSTTSINASRIYSIHWLTPDVLLTSENDGKMQIWVLSENKNDLTPKEEFTLPVSKERWATSAVIFNNNLVAVGDRKGNIHLFKFGESEAVQSVKKAHSHLGITNLFIVNNQLVSMGRNGILKVYNYNPDTHLTQISNDKLPFTWLAKMEHQKNSHILLGFSGSNFIIWDHTHRRILHEINCGGGHRSWDFNINDADLLNFIFIKEKIIHRFSCDWSNITTLELVAGYHTKEINSLVMLRVGENNLLVLSGGEDTTVRVGAIDLTLGNASFQSVSILKSHLSSVRCVETFPVGNKTYLMITAGGRAQIVVWKLKINPKSDVFECNEVDSYYKHLDDSESEIRIMDLTIIPSFNILITACSDGTLRCYKINALLKLEHMNTFTYALKCIIKVEYIKICGRDIIISMATDGKLTFWDFTSFCVNITANIKPFFKLPVHQSGINCFSYKNVSENLFLFATGGDDNAVILNLVHFDHIDDNFNAKLITKYRNTQAHGAQVTGMYTYDNIILSTSIDQSVSIFEYNLVKNDLNCGLIKQYSSVVADIQGMHCLKHEYGIYVCVFGKGIEIIDIKLNR